MKLFISFFWYFAKKICLLPVNHFASVKVPDYKLLNVNIKKFIYKFVVCVCVFLFTSNFAPFLMTMMIQMKVFNRNNRKEEEQRIEENRGEEILHVI